MPYNYSTSSGLKTAASQVSTLSGALCGIDVVSASSGTNTLIVYDSFNSDLSGKRVLAVVDADAGTGSVNHEFFVPVGVNHGIYVDVTGPGTDYQFVVRYTL